MSSSATTDPAHSASGPSTSAVPEALDWPLIRRQVGGIFRFEFRRNLLGRRSAVMYFLAFAPALILVAWAVAPLSRQFMSGPTDAILQFAVIFELILRTTIFLSALILFMSLFRSEILQKSLHYYLLTPVRREVLVVGKYLSALLAIWIVFIVSTTVIYLANFMPWGPGALTQFLFQGPGLGNLAIYLVIVTLACAGYGAVFLLAGLFLRNPVVAAVVIWAWEAGNFILPSYLKYFSVIFYLQSLFPVPTPVELLAILADPAPAWLSVPGLILFTAFVLFVACWRVRRMELNYGDD